MLAAHGVHQQVKSQTGIGQPARRHHDRALKTRLVDQCLEPGASVAAIAMDNAINANQLFKWRRERRSQTASHILPTTLPLPATERVATPTVLLPAHITPDDDAFHPDTTLRPAAVALSTTTVITRPARPGVIELEIAGAQLLSRASEFRQLGEIRLPLTLGCCTNQHGPGVWPQIRAVCLMDTYSHELLDAQLGAMSQGEVTLATRLQPRANPSRSSIVPVSRPPSFSTGKPGARIATG